MTTFFEKCNIKKFISHIFDFFSFQVVTSNPILGFNSKNAKKCILYILKIRSKNDFYIKNYVVVQGALGAQKTEISRSESIQALLKISEK